MGYSLRSPLQSLRRLSSSLSSLSPLSPSLSSPLLPLSSPLSPLSPNSAMKYKSSSRGPLRLRMALFSLTIFTCSISFFLISSLLITWGECVTFQIYPTGPAKDLDNLYRSPYWDYFDQIYCLHSHTAVEREEDIHNSLNLLHLLDDIHWWDVEIDLEDGHRGTWNGHKSIAQHALDNNYTKILIFEDDILIDPILKLGVDHVMQKVVNFLTLTPSWEVFFFTHNCKKIELTTNPDFVRVNSWSTVAFALHLDGISKLAQSTFVPEHTVDSLLYENENAYAIYPMVIEHKPNLSYTIKANRTNDVNVKWRKAEEILHKDALKRNMFACGTPLKRMLGQLAYRPPKLP